MTNEKRGLLFAYLADSREMGPETRVAETEFYAPRAKAATSPFY